MTLGSTKQTFAKIGDTKQILVADLNDENGDPLDDIDEVTDAVLRMVRQFDRANATAIEIPLDVDVAAGAVTHQWEDGEVDEATTYLGTIHLTYLDGERIIPTQGYLYLTFEEPI